MFNENESFSQEAEFSHTVAVFLVASYASAFRDWWISVMNITDASCWSYVCIFYYDIWCHGFIITVSCNTNRKSPGLFCSPLFFPTRPLMIIFWVICGWWEIESFLVQLSLHTIRNYVRHNHIKCIHIMMSTKCI